MQTATEFERQYPRPTEWEEWMLDKNRRRYKTPKNEEKAQKQELQYWRDEWDRQYNNLKREEEEAQYKYLPRSYYFRDKLVQSGLSEEQVEMLGEYVTELIREMAEANQGE